MSDQMRLLLDKNIVRRYFEGVSALGRGLTLVEEERRVILLVHLARRKKRRLFISVEVFNLLRAHGRQVSPAETLMFLKRGEVLYPGRYFKRWARRLRETGFTREDAKVLALGTFGTDAEGAVLGVQVVVTYDRPMMSKWALGRSELQERLARMTEVLDDPFGRVRLPDVLYPEEIT
jgi:hypothetical protein